MRELLTIRTKGIDSTLRHPSREIKKIDAEIRELASELLARLTPLGAIGLSAPQFGENVQLFVIEMQGLKIVMLNPKLVKSKGIYRVHEGCTSIPGKMFMVQRPKLVKFKGIDLDGREFVAKGHDRLAQVLCHEVDHLKGVLIDAL